MVQYEYAINLSGDRVNASLVPSGVEYYCVECGDPMYAVPGDVQSPHFRHKNAFGNASNVIHEGPLHYNTKFLIYDYIKMFFDAGKPLCIKISDKNGFKHYINILELATSVDCEVNLSSKYRPDISIVGGKLDYAIEIIHTHPMTKSAVRYVNDNKINVIKVGANEPFLDWLKVSFERKDNFIFRSTQRNVKFILHSNIFNLTHFRCFYDFGMSLYNKLENGVRKYILKKYELDEFMFTQKKRHEFEKYMESVYDIIESYELDSDRFLSLKHNEFNNDMGVVYKILEVYELDANTFLSKKHNELAILIKPAYDLINKYEKDCIDFKNKCASFESIDLKTRLYLMYVKLNSFRTLTLRTGMVTINMEKKFTDLYPEYKIFKKEVHTLTNVGNAHGWCNETKITRFL